MNLSTQQKIIVDDNSPKTVVMAAAASGKTNLLTEKVRKILRSGINPKKIAVITFTNMAAAELRERLGEDYKDGIYIGTIHSLANHFLLSSGISTSSIIDEEKFDEFFKLVEKNPQCIRPMEWVFLDEAQDSTQEQYDFIFKMIQPKNFFVVGDTRQSIYTFNGAVPELLIQLAKEEDVTYFEMNENYRNLKNILSFAQRIVKKIGESDPSIPVRIGRGMVIETEFEYRKVEEKIRGCDDYKDWAVLGATNSDVAKVYTYLTERGIPCVTFKQGGMSKEELQEKMNDNSVKILTMHSSKGLEWKNVIVLPFKMFNDERVRLAYVAATRARDMLIWMKEKRKTYPTRTKMVQW